MTPQKFLEQELAKLQEFKPKEVKKDLLADEIFRLLMSKKFRKYSVNPEYINHIRQAILLCVEENKPIQVTLVFGGYKLWRLDEFPTVDWAELFSLIYYANWSKAVCEIYKPGVWFDFFSDDIIVPQLNNINKDDTKAYAESFEYLLHFIKHHLPKNLIFTLNSVGKQYTSYSEFENDLEKQEENLKKELGGKLPVLTPELTRTLELNVRLTPEQNKDIEWKEKVQFLHDAYARVSKRRPYYRVANKIFLSTRAVKDSLSLGTTKTSVAKFWVGVGVLKKNEDSYREYILSPKQLEQAHFKIEQIHIKGLDEKNFQTIRIIE